MQTRNLRELVLSSLFVALIAIGAIIRIPLGSTVYTLQFLATLLAGALLGGRLGALAVLTYTVMGLVGLPVFASGGGPSYILQPTFGYLVAFMLQAYVGGTYIRRSGPITFKKQLTAHLIGLVIVYTVGIAYFLCSEPIFAAKHHDFRCHALVLCGAADCPRPCHLCRGRPYWGAGLPDRSLDQVKRKRKKEEHGKRIVCYRYRNGCGKIFRHSPHGEETEGAWV